MTEATARDGPGVADPAVVLVVEDEVLIRLDLAEILRDAGFLVLEAADAAEAMALIAITPVVNLVITDVRMPGEIDGIGLAREIRRRRQDLPIVIASGHWQDDGAPLADRILSKPYSADQILTIARDLLSQSCQSKTCRSLAS